MMETKDVCVAEVTSEMLEELTAKCAEVYIKRNSRGVELRARCSWRIVDARQPTLPAALFEALGKLEKREVE